MSITSDVLRSNLVRSGLMTAEEVRAFQHGLPPEKQSADAVELARQLVHGGKLTKYQAQRVYAGAIAGLVIDQYVVLDTIGEGGMGMVLKAQHRKMKRYVAIKALNAHRLKSSEALHRFLREVETAAKLSHPNIVTAYDAREQDGEHYLIMEYVDGKDLALTLKELGPLPIDTGVEYCLQAARGLLYAHKRRIIHRDIKPGNLLLDKEGTVKVLDMGLARIVDEGTASLNDDGGDKLTSSGQVMGTYDYMAPEQAFDSHNVDARADIYSLGCTLYRLVTGHRPYSGGSLMQVLIAHSQSPIPRLRDARPDAPEELEVVYQRMVAKQPDDRYATMADVISDLEAFLHLTVGDRADEEDSTNTQMLKGNLSFLTKPPDAASAEQRGIAAVEEVAGLS